MLKLKSEKLELRGLANKSSKNGNIYYVLNCESYDGTPHAFYCPSSDCFPQGLKKADEIFVTFEVSYYKGTPKLVVSKVEKVA